jgi:hypothetical protein
MYDCIIVNGDSYSAKHKLTNVYSDYVNQHLNIPVINIAALGSSNDRIVRSTIEKVLEIKSQYKSVLMIIGWSFVRRIEVWYYGDNIKVTSLVPDKNAREDYKNLRLVTLDQVLKHNEATLEQKCLINEDLFVHKQLTDFYTNIFLTSQFLQNNNIDYFFFSAAKNSEVPLGCFPAIENLAQVQAVANDPNIFQLHSFHIKQWAEDNDKDASPVSGHLSAEGHKNFSNWVIEKITKYDIQLH